MSFEPVEIFDQFISLLIIKLKDVSIRKFFWVVAYRFIDAFCLHTVQFGDITVEDYLLVAQGDDFSSTLGTISCCFMIFRFG